MPRREVIDFRRRYDFAVSGPELWDAIGRVDQFETWWPWLRDFEVDGDALAPGAVWRGVIAPPFPYRMRLAVKIVRSVPGASLDAQVEGDLEGTAKLVFGATPQGTSIDIAWSVEMRHPSLRLATRLANPLVRWSQEWVVDHTVSGFRRRLEFDPL